MSAGLTRGQIREGLAVGVIETGTGMRWCGIVHSLTADEVRVWIPSVRIGDKLTRPEDRGFLTSVTFAAAEAGALWIEHHAPEHPTGRDLLAYWGWAKRSGLVTRPSAAGYLQGARTVLADLPDGYDTDLRSLDLEAAIARFTDAHQGDLAPASIAQYTSGFRRAVRRYLTHNPLAQHAGGAR